MKAALLEFKKEVTKSVLLMVKEVTDVETQSVLFNSLTKMTVGGHEFDADVKKDISNSVASMARQKLGIETSKRRRKRRATGGSGDGDGNVMTITEVRG